MNDREKVMRALEAHISGMRCEDCPYGDECDYTDEMPAVLGDALELLKIRDVEIKSNEYHWKFYHCPTCGKDFYGFDKRVRFCNQCGQGIKWPEKEDADE